METKPWYKSKLIWAGGLVTLTGGLESLQESQLVGDQMVTMILGVVIAYLRKAHTNTVVK